MRPRTQHLEKGHDVVDKVVEVELAVPQTDVSSVLPIGQVDVVIDKKRLRRTAQQGRKMPDIGATRRTRGCAATRSFSRCTSVQKGV
jgi:hypothetical protein